MTALKAPDVRARELIAQARELIASTRTHSPRQSLEHEPRTHVDTATAAYHLNLEAETLLKWSSKRNGPIQPVKVRGRLSWPVAELRRVLGITQ